MKKVVLFIILLLFPISVYALDYPSINSKYLEVYDLTDKKVIYEINSNTLEYKEINSYSDGNTISASVTNTNNLYMLFDKNYLINETNIAYL